MTRDIGMIQDFYGKLRDRIAAARRVWARPLTLTEKILCAHLDALPSQPLTRGKDYADLRPDRVAMQDATAQMALLQFMQAGRDTAAVPTTVHCDHLVTAKEGAAADLPRARTENEEVYGFLRSVCRRYGMGFWPAGSGIIHQIVLENYAFPGGLMIGTDSHTPTSGGLGMMGVGVGGADAVDVMAGMAWELKWPKVIGVRLSGELSGWASPKDVILEVLGRLSVKGGTGAVMEYFGSGCAELSATGKATIGNMGAELGATATVFPFDESMAAYLAATGRAEVAELARANAAVLAADPEAAADPASCYDQVIDIDLSTLGPRLNGPFSPDLRRTPEEMAAAAEKEGFPLDISACLIGSCTNSSFEDLSRAASVVKAALDAGLKPKAKLYLSPGSERVRDAAEKAGILAVFERAGAIILANACGPCIGMWDRSEFSGGGKNSIVHSFNRNFAKRADGNPNTCAFVAGPEFTAALAFAGRLDFDPSEDPIVTADGKKLFLTQPTALPLPASFASCGSIGPEEAAADPASVKVEVPVGSSRLQLLSPFPAWDGKDIGGARVLLKAKGKCTTDHISMAGEWLTYRGHLDNISNNLLLGAVNAFSGKAGDAQLPDGARDTPAKAARAWKAAGVPWVIVGDENYGEGSSREHAAMEPRHLGAVAVIVKSFARIHETNLKKQGMLAFTFADPADWDRIGEGDAIDLPVTKLMPGSPLQATLVKKDGRREPLILNHTYNEGQIAWFKAGSALNLIAQASGKR